MTASVTTLAAVLLVRGDDPWQQTVVFYTDPSKAATYDLTGKVITATIVWKITTITVDVDVTDPAGGEVTLSLASGATLPLPLGQLPTLFIAIDTTTWARAPVNVLEGRFMVGDIAVQDYRYEAPISGATITLSASDEPILVIDPAAVIAALTIVLPSGTDGKRFTIVTRQRIDALTISGVDPIDWTTNELPATGAIELMYAADVPAWVLI